MSETFPKATEVGMAANLLAITFDNGQTRYMRSHFMKDYLDAWSPSRGKGKRSNLLVDPAWAWEGADAKISEDGTLTLFDKDTYTPEELWKNSKKRIDEVSGV